MSRLLSNGAKTFRNDLFLLKFAGGIERSRFSFSVPKKLAKSAVMRNRLKRQGYLALTEYISEIRPDILATFSFRMIPLSIKETNTGLESILRAAKLIK